MNAKTARRLRKLAASKATIKKGDAIEPKTLFWKKSKLGRWIDGSSEEFDISWHTYRYKQGSARKIYQELKKAYLATPRPLRRNFLLSWETLS